MVIVSNVGWNVVDIEGLTTSEFLLRAMSLSPDGSIENPQEFLNREPPVQCRFMARPLPSRINSEVCRPIAAGGERTSYRFCNLLDLTVPEQMELRIAETLPRGSARWVWRSPNEHPWLAEGVTLDITQETAGVGAWFDEQIQLMSVAGKQPSRGTWEGRSCKLHWLRVEDYGFLWRFYWSLGGHEWLGDFSFPTKLAARFTDEAERIAKSIRPVP